MWLVLSSLALGCGGEAAKEVFDFTETIAVGSADLWNAAVLVEDAGPCGVAEGAIDAPWQVRGLTAEAEAGATLRVEAAAWAGPGSTDRAGGQPLDTVAALYGPMAGVRPGPLLAYADDSGDTLQAALDPVVVASDGWYLAVMTVWDDPGQGWFELSLRIDGASCAP
jgi:hypothetical protein